MPKFAANLSMMYLEFQFCDRFSAAANDGFKGVEVLFPYQWPSSEIAQWSEAAGVTQVLINSPPGNWNENERGLAALPGRETEFQDGIGMALEYAKALDCPRIHVMAGLRLENVSDRLLYDTYELNLHFAALEAAKQGCNIIIEPINTRDVPGYFLNRQADAHSIIETLNLPNLRLQMDLYHLQIAEGDLIMKIRQYINIIDHFQIAGVPGRHEPNIGEVNFECLYDLIDGLDFKGWIGCEYRPIKGTSSGLVWAEKYLT